MNLLKIVILCLFLTIVNITDIKEYKIKNKVVMPMIVIGLTVSIIEVNILDGIYGLLIPLVLFPLYALQMLGAGDIKAFCAIGCLMGFEFSVATMAFSMISGGIIALGFMIVNKNFIERFKYLFRYLKLCLYAREVIKYEYGGNNKSYFRFSYAISCGTVLAVINTYFMI